jgi:hypothetical protein
LIDKKIIVFQGGTLGLFIGVSLLSVVEVLEIAMEIFFTWYYHKKNPKIDIRKS